MSELYRAKRRDFEQSHRTFMHHIAWGVICVLLISCLGGLWIYAQSLNRENQFLKQQLVVAQKPRGEVSTCRVTGTWQPGTTTVREAVGRQYLVHTPADFKDGQYYPILLFYPGKGATAPAAQVAYKLDSLPAIVIYPEPTVGTDGFTAWEGAPYSSPSDDVAFTTAIIDQVQSYLCIDRTKIYVAGLSNGGGFASMLSCELPERIAAFAIVAGAMYDPAGGCKPDQPRPLLTIHGDHDPTVPYYGSALRRLPAITDWSTHRAEFNDCKSSSTSTENIFLSTTTWTNCKNDATVQSIRVINGGHGWSDITNDTIWQFLSKFSL